MATEVVTRRTKVKLNKGEDLLPGNERYLQACQAISNALIQEYEAQNNDSTHKKDLNLNRLIGDMSRKYRLSNQPPLTAIIAAVPENYKKHILPKLIAKPIRTSSGIAVVAVMCKPHRCPHINFTGLFNQS